MDLAKFLETIVMPPEAVGELKKFISERTVSEEDYVRNKQLFQKDRQLFYERIKKNKNYRLYFLYYFCRMGAETYLVYKERGIGDVVFGDTFYDLTLWCENCFREYGEYGINEYDWFFRHINLQLFRLGRLEFERLENAINIHIPEGEKLTEESVTDSLAKGMEFMGRELPYMCHSWLLYPGLQEILPESSNIIQFQKRFRIISTDSDGREAKWRIFGKAKGDLEKYPQQTSLQKRAKEYLQSGKTLGSGLGVLK